MFDLQASGWGFAQVRVTVSFCLTGVSCGVDQSIPHLPNTQRDPQARHEGLEGQRLRTIRNRRGWLASILSNFEGFESASRRHAVTVAFAEFAQFIYSLNSRCHTGSWLPPLQACHL